MEHLNIPPENHVKVLGGQGWVGLIDHLGTEATIVNAARVSFGKLKSTMDERDVKLLNYLIENGELEQCFSLVHNYLDPDGLFLFDMNMPSKFQNYYDGRDFILESDDGSAYCGWQSTFDSQTRLCQFSLTIFELNEDGTYNRAEECQWERAYEEGEIVRALTESGFELLASSSQGFSKADNPKAGTGRRYFAARCKKPGVVSPA